MWQGNFFAKRQIQMKFLSKEKSTLLNTREEVVCIYVQGHSVHKLPKATP
jgi:hypothetical protein